VLSQSLENSRESLDKRGLGSGSEQEAWFLPLIAADAISNDFCAHLQPLWAGF
jgi:hypothetical protein